MKKEAGIPREELIGAIHRYCLECSGNYRQMVEQCPIRNCALYPYRNSKAMGKRAPVTIQGQLSIYDMPGKGESS